MYDLKRCPFCGSVAELIEARCYVTTGWRVRCVACKINTGPVWINQPCTKGDGTLNESTRYTSNQAAQIAVDKWNRRAEP